MLAIAGCVKEDMGLSEEFIRKALFQGPHFVFWKDRAGIYLGCNENFARLSGIGDPDDIVGKTDVSLVWPLEQAEVFIRMDREVLERGEPSLNCEQMCVGNSDVRMCVLASRVPIKDAAGEVTGLAGVFVDVTDLKQHEIELSDRIADLQRYKDIVFDRELRLLALKREVNGLAKELGRPNVYDLSFLRDTIPPS